MTNLWVMPDDLGDESRSPYAYEACQTASYMLWALSGRKFHGVNTTTETYECAPCRNDESSFDVRPRLINGNVYNVSCNDHFHLRLRGRPVISVEEVRTGAGSMVLEPGSYWVENKSVLASRSNLCGAQITYTYGAQPPVAGRRAARYLASQLVKSWEGDDDCELPDRVTNVSRQGVTYQLLDNNTFIDDSRTGIYSVDLFLKTVNPDGARKPAKVFSPDLPRAKRVTRQPLVGVPSVFGPYDLQIVPGRSLTWTIDLAAVNGTLLDNTNYVPRGQISAWNGATVFEAGPEHFTLSGTTLTCTLSAIDTRRTVFSGQGTWELYAVSAQDASTVINLLTSNVWTTA